MCLHRATARNSLSACHNIICSQNTDNNMSIHIWFPGHNWPDSPRDTSTPISYEFVDFAAAVSTSQSIDRLWTAIYLLLLLLELLPLSVIAGMV